MFFLFILFILFIRSDCGEYENAKELVSSFKSIVDIPLSKDFKKAHAFLAFGQALLKKTVPFAELLAVALKIGLEEDQLEILLNVTRGIDMKVADIQKKLARIESSEVYRDLLLDYDREVDKPLFGLLNKISFMAKMRMNFTQEEVGRFVDDCLSITSSPSTVALYLSKLVTRCEWSNISFEVSKLLFDMIYDQVYMDYTMSNADQSLYYERFAALSFWLSSHPEKVDFVKQFSKERGHIRNKQVLLAILMSELKVGFKVAGSLCLPFAAFVANGYKRAAVERFSDVLMNHVASLEYITIMCANITYFGQREKADLYSSNIVQILKPVNEFVSTWINRTFDSTWPDTERLLIRDFMHDLSKGSLFSRQNSSYEKIANALSTKMEPIGHPNYRRQYILLPGFTPGFESKHFDYDCKDSACIITYAMDANCLAIRTDTKTNKVYESLQDLQNFVNGSYNTFTTAMNNELYQFEYPSTAVQVLGDKYGLDLKQFISHSAYVIMHVKEYPKGCSSLFYTKADEDLGTSYLQQMYYHWDGNWLTNCDDWVFYLGF